MTENAPEQSSPPGPGNNKGRRVAIVAVVLALLCGLVVLVYWWLNRNLESTDDAFVQSDIVRVAPRVTGTVTRVFVRNNQPVHKGDPLFALDPADYQAILNKAEANLQAARASYKASQQDLSVTRTTSAADIERARAALAAARAEAHRSAADAKRYRALYAKHEVSRQQLGDATTSATAASAKVREASARLTQAKAAPDQIALKRARAATAKAKIAQARAEVERARLNLSYTRVRAPQSGQVTKKSIVAGSHVSAGQTALAIVENDPWVIANFKETQLSRMQIGQPVSIEIDAFPDRTFSGRIQSIQAGTGVTFSLLPPENATGNYVKIVQRVPVKIVFDQPAQLAKVKLAPGMSAVPTVNLVGRIKLPHPAAADAPARQTADTVRP